MSRPPDPGTDPGPSSSPAPREEEQADEKIVESYKAPCEICGHPCSRGLAHRWHATWAWDGWLLMAARGPYLLATIMVVLCLTVGVTGLQQRIWFCVVGGYELGTFGYATSNTSSVTGGGGQTQPLYTVQDIADGQWYGTLTFSGLLAGLAGGALLFLASLILIVVRFGGSHLCASASACCTCDPGSESARSRKSRSKQTQKQLRKARKQYWISLWGFSGWVVVFSGGIFGWMEWQGADGGLGQDLLLGLLVCVALWVFTHKLFLDGYTRLRKEKRRRQRGQKDVYELRRTSEKMPERSAVGWVYHHEEDKMDDEYVGDDPLGKGPRAHGPDD